MKKNPHQLRTVDYHEFDIEDRGIDAVRNTQFQTGSKEDRAQRQAIENYNIKAEEERLNARDERERDMVKHARGAKWAAIVAATSSVIAIGVAILKD